MTLTFFVQRFGPAGNKQDGADVPTLVQSRRVPLTPDGWGCMEYGRFFSLGVGEGEWTHSSKNCSLNFCLFEQSDESVEAKSRTKPPRLLSDSRDNVCWARGVRIFLVFWLGCEKSKKHCLQCACARKAHLTYCLYNSLNWHIFHLGNRAINHLGWCFFHKTS